MGGVDEHVADGRSAHNQPRWPPGLATAAWSRIGADRGVRRRGGSPQRLSAAFTVFIVIVADYTWLSTWPPLRDP